MLFNFQEVRIRGHKLNECLPFVHLGSFDHWHEYILNLPILTQVLHHILFGGFWRDMGYKDIYVPLSLQLLFHQVLLLCWWFILLFYLPIRI